MRKFILKRTIASDISGTVCDLLAERSGLSKSKIKDAMNKGAVWIKRKKGGMKRLRKATTIAGPDDAIEFYYDEDLLSRKPPRAVCLSDQRYYSVWFKPEGLMAQGSQYGDHCSLLRQAELSFGPARKVFLVHRLDREASGLMLIAHSGEAASRLSELFRNNRIIKRYRVEVRGDLRRRADRGVIDLPLDDKPSVTEFAVDAYTPETDSSSVRVTLRTGRLHQIRRHFEMIGFPVIGDPKYGRGNKNTEGMKLSAVSLLFRCPYQNREVEFTLPELLLQ